MQANRKERCSLVAPDCWGDNMANRIDRLKQIYSQQTGVAEAAPASDYLESYRAKKSQWSAPATQRQTAGDALAIQTQPTTLKTIQQKQVQQPVQQPTAQKPSLASEIKRGAGYGTGKLIKGALGAIEGIGDIAIAVPAKSAEYVLSLGGRVQDPVSQSFGRLAQDVLDTSITEQYGKRLEEKYKPGKAMQVVGGIEEAAGGLIPAVASGIGLGQVASGLGTTAQAAKAALPYAGKAVIGTSAAGRSASEARREGADTGRALMYGLTSGGLETSIESIAGGLPGLPKGIGSEVIGKLTSSPAASVITDIVGEGGEEALQTFIDPFVKRAIYDPNAKNASAKNIAQSAVTGALLSGIMQGAIGNFSAAVADNNVPVEKVESVKAEFDKLPPDMKETVAKESGYDSAKSLNMDIEQAKTAATSQPVAQPTTVAQPALDTGVTERGYARTVRTKADLPDEIKQDFVDNPEVYEKLTNEATIQKADEIIAKGIDAARADFDRLVKTKSPEAIPVGNELARQYIAQGNKEQAVTVVRELAQELTKSGQFSQAAAIGLMQSDPETALRYIVRDIDKLNADGAKRFGKGWKNFELTESEMNALSNVEPGDTAGIENVFTEIGNRLAREYPVKAYEKFVEASRIAMLLNPRTNVRNVVSNAMLRPLTRASGVTSAVMQNIYAHFDKSFTPTQAVLIKKDTRKAAEDVWGNVKDTLLEKGSKYEESIKVAGKQKQIYKPGRTTALVNNIAPGMLDKINAKFGKDSAGVAETIRNFNYYLLEAGDTPFVKKNFVDRLGSYMQAQGIQNAADVPPEAITTAYSEALKATFKDDNQLTALMSGIKKNLGGVGEVVLPFTKTPANIAMRGIDYSPAGIYNTVKLAKTGADKGKVIDELAKNLTGTGMIALGAFLAAKGIITGAAPDNKKQAAFLRQQGWKPYSIKVGDKYVTYDWAQPAAIPLIFGATFQQNRGDGTTSFIGDVLKGVSASSDAWLELSPLSSLKEILGGYGSPTEKFMETIAAYPQRLIPSSVGATARVADTTQRQTFSKGQPVRTQIDIAKSKIPGLSKTLPVSYNTWGQPVKRDESTGAAAISQYVNPGSVGVKQSEKIDPEINRLYEAIGDENVFPRKADYTITKGGQKYDLDNVTYSTYQKQMGDQSLKSVSAFIESPAYNEFDDETKVKIIKSLYDDAKLNADQTVLKKKGVEVDNKTKQKVSSVFASYTPENTAKYMIAKEIVYNTPPAVFKSTGREIPDSRKQNAIERLQSIGYSKVQANNLYKQIRG